MRTRLQLLHKTKTKLYNIKTFSISMEKRFAHIIWLPPNNFLDGHRRQAVFIMTRLIINLWRQTHHVPHQFSWQISVDISSKVLAQYQQLSPVMNRSSCFNILMRIVSLNTILIQVATKYSILLTILNKFMMLITVPIMITCMLSLILWQMEITRRLSLTLVQEKEKANLSRILVCLEF